MTAAPQNPPDQQAPYAGFDTEPAADSKRIATRRLWGLPWWANLLIPTLILGGLVAAVWTGVPVIALFTVVAGLLVEDAFKHRPKPHPLLLKLFEVGVAAGMTLGALIITLDATGVLAGVL